MKMALKLKLKFKYLICTSSFLFLLTGCGTTKVNNNFFAFNTTISNQYVGSNNVSNDIEKLFLRLSDIFDTFKAIPGLNNAYSVNNSTDFIDVDPDLINVLKMSINYQQQTNGIFNPLVKNLTSLWKESLKNKNLPDQNLIDDEINKINTSSILFSENYKVKLSGLGKIDLGAISKGYAVSLALDLFNNNNIKDYILNAGNSSIILGENSNSDGFYNVGIRNVNNKYLKLKNISIGTSSIYEQDYLKINNDIYSHIIDARNGSAKVKNHLCIALSPSPIISDIYSTIGMMLNADELKEIESKTDVKYLTFINGNISYCNENIEVFTHE